MKIDFPPSELKPLSMIYDAIERGIYECLGLMDGTDIVGYAYLIRKGDDYLIDYLAVCPDRRNAGLGSEMLRLLGEYLAVLSGKWKTRNLQKRKQTGNYRQDDMAFICGTDFVTVVSA